MGDKDIADRQGRDRKLFASAITPNGLVNYLDTLINTDKVYVLKGMPGTGTERVIQKIRKRLWKEVMMLNLFIAH